MNRSLERNILRTNRRVEIISLITIILSAMFFSSSLILNLFLGSYAGYFRVTLIVAINVISFYCVSRYRYVQQIYSVFNIGFEVIFFSCFTMIVFSAIIGQAPIIAIGYSLITYVSFYCLSYLTVILSNNTRLTKYLLIFLIILCLFLSMGILYDAIIGLVNIPFLGDKIQPILSEISTVDGTGARRGGFFFGSATSVFPFLSMGTLSCVLLRHVFKSDNEVFILFLSVVVIWLGYFFSYSRAPIILGSSFSIYAIFKVCFLPKEQKTLPFLTSKSFISSILVIIFLLLLSTHFHKLVDFAGEYQINRLHQTTSLNDPGNSQRFQAWQLGIKQFENPDAWIGKGLGESNLRMKRKFDYLGQPQYESSILLTFAEGGIFGLIARLTPLFLILFSLRSSPLKFVFYLWSFLMFCNLFASPLINGHPVQYAYFLGMSLTAVLSTKKRVDYSR